jgi:dihydroneopterin aldolase
MKQCIHIKGLRVTCHVGVPDEELAVAQQLLLHLELEPIADWRELDDQIERTIDYAAVVAEIEEIATARPRRLIETLATDIGTTLLGHHPLRRVRVMIEKFILPQTQAVAVEWESSLPPH